MQTAMAQNDVAPPPEKPKTLNERVDEFLELIVEADGEFTEEVELALLSIEEKAEAYKRIKAMLESRAEFYRSESQKYARWCKREETHAEKLTQWLAEGMDRAGLSEIKTRIGKVYFLESPTVKITEEDRWVESAPAEYVKTEKSAKKAALIAFYRDAVKKHLDPNVNKKDAAAVAAAKRKAHELALAEMPKGADVVISRSLVL